MDVPGPESELMEATTSIPKSGGPAPDFTATTTHRELKLSQWPGGNPVVAPPPKNGEEVREREGHAERRRFDSDPNEKTLA